MASTPFGTLTALLVDPGATPKVVQRRLRHSDARTTLQIYGHVVGDAHRAAVEKVASIVDPNRIEAINGFNSLVVYGDGFNSHGLHLLHPNAGRERRVHSLPGAIAIHFPKADVRGLIPLWNRIASG